MCTLLTLSAEKWSREAEARIKQDAEWNPDGFSLLLVTPDGAHSQLRAMDIETILLLLRNVEWSRFFLHSRYATQGEVRLDTTHGWAEEGVFYQHNGCLSSPDARAYEVDSQAIGAWLFEGGVEFALGRLRDEKFANVFLIDVVAGFYAVSRSVAGSLFTDGDGNYSTHPVGDVCLSVMPGVDYWSAWDVRPEAPVDFEKYLNVGGVG